MVRRAVLLEEARPARPVGRPDQGRRPPGQVREHHRCDPAVVVDDVGFAEPGGGVEHLVEVGERQLAALDLDADALCPLWPAILEWDPMPSAIWTGSISFGLVQVPVKLVGATKSKDVSFNQLEEGTGARIRYKKVSDKTGEEVTADKIKRGYEVSKGRT